MESVLSRLLISHIILILFLYNPAYAQNKYIIQHYTNENGLRANSIRGLELDKEAGILWIGTQAGLVRFDGKHLEDFGSEQHMVAGARSLFLGKNKGTIYYEDDNFSVYQIKNNRPEFLGIDSLHLASYKLNGSEYTFKSANEFAEVFKHHRYRYFPPDWVLYHREAGKSNHFSFVYSGHGYYYNADENKLFDFPGFNDVFYIGNSVFFLRSNNAELFKYDDSLRTLVTVKVNGMPRWSKEDEKPKFIWKLGMADPLVVFKQDIWKLQKNGNDLALMPLCKDCCPADAEVNNIQVWEEQGIIFIGSNVNGLYVARAPFLRSLRTDPDMETGIVEYAMAEMKPGIIMTASGLTFSANGDLLSSTAAIKFKQSNIYRDKHGDHWFCRKDTIIHYYQHDGGYKKIAVNDKSYKAVFAETNNRIYVISDVAIGEITGDKYRLIYKVPQDAHGIARSFYPEDATEFSPGILAISTNQLILVDVAHGTAPDTVPIPGLTANVRGLLKYGDYLLIGTYGQGFYIYKNGVVKKMPLDKNRYLAYTHCFMPDKAGFCWISTNHGLFKVSLNALISAYDNNLKEIYYHYFGKNDGIYNTEFNGGCQPCALKTSSGLFAFPSMDGVAIFDPVSRHAPPPTGKMFVDEIQVDSIIYHPNDSALYTLPYDIKNLRFRIRLSQFGNPENIYFSYKLEPYNNTWQKQDITQNDELFFGGLKPGNYKLYLRVRNGYGAEQFGVNVVTFRILPPWYQAWWFYLLCILAFTALIWGLVKWRTARIEKRKEELQELVTIQTKSIADQKIRLEEDNKIKSRLISIISHDMISPLKFLTYLSELMLNTFSQSDKNYRIVNSIATVSQDIESLSVSLLNWIRFHHESIEMKPERFNLKKLVTESVGIASKLANEKGIQFYIEIPEEIEVFQYAQAIGVIVYNLAINAVKYTDAGEIRIVSYQEGSSFSISIADTGPGMEAEVVQTLNNLEFFEFNYSGKEVKKYQFGYVIIKDLLRLSKGNMKVESILNKGTCVTIHFTNCK